MSHLKLLCTLRESDFAQGGKVEKHSIFPALAQPLELVTISQGFCSNMSSPKIVDYIFEWSHPERPKEAENYGYHNVMWIQWEDGIAYRKGLGRVERSVWERQALDDVDLIVG